MIDVEAGIPNPRPYPNKCHYYDHPKKKYGALKPFHNCQVVRIEIDESGLRLKPIAAIPGKAIMGVLTKRADFSAIRDLLGKKGLGDIQVFPVL